MTMQDLKIGSTGKILKNHMHGTLKQRFMDMGITQGTVVQVVKIAPLGDPIELLIRGYNLSIRKEDAKQIDVEEV